MKKFSGKTKSRTRTIANGDVVKEIINKEREFPKKVTHSSFEPIKPEEMLKKIATKIVPGKFTYNQKYINKLSDIIKSYEMNEIIIVLKEDLDNFIQKINLMKSIIEDVQPCLDGSNSNKKMCYNGLIKVIHDINNILINIIVYE